MVVFSSLLASFLSVWQKFSITALTGSVIGGVGLVSVTLFAFTYNATPAGKTMCEPLPETTVALGGNCPENEIRTEPHAESFTSCRDRDHKIARLTKDIRRTSPDRILHQIRYRAESTLVNYEYDYCPAGASR